MSSPPTFTPLDRRQWLKTAGATLAGVVLASRLPGAPMPESTGPREPRVDPAATPAPRGERRYIHGFEAYPSG